MAKRARKKKPVAARSMLSGGWLWALLLVTAVLIAYFPTSWAGYIWDDDAVVTQNATIIGPLGLKEIWTTHAADICPLTLTTFWAEHALWGLAPLPYHLVNVLMHAACAVVLWRVLLALEIPGAWLGAAIWALHPVQAESAAWITEMKNTESGLFYLLAILFFLRGARGANLGLTLLFAAMAMASKSSTMVLPAVLLLAAWWKTGRRQRSDFIRVAPIGGMSLAVGIASMATQRWAGSDDPYWARSWPERFAVAGDAVWFYLGKLAWPHPLILIYPRWPIDDGQALAYLPLAAVLGVSAILWIWRGTWARPWFAAWAYFLITLSPVLGFVNMTFLRYSFVADHFQYLAAMGPLALAGAGFVRISNFVPRPAPWLSSALGAAVLMILGVVTFQRVRIFQDAETIWNDTLARNPACWAAYNNLGNINLARGQNDVAIAQYHQAETLNPRNVETFNNLGSALYLEKQIPAALAEFAKAEQIDPHFANVYNSMGKALFENGQPDAALAQLEKAVELQPVFAQAQNNLGDVLLQKGHVDEALAHYREAVRDDPRFAEAHNNLGFALARHGNADEAIAEYQKALALAPTYAEFHNNLGITFAGQRRFDEAAAEFAEAVRLKPDFAAAQQNLARAQAQAAQH